MDSHIPPRCSRHHRFVLEYRPEIVVELVEPESNADGNHCDKNVTVAPAESLQRVHPLTRELIGRMVGNSVNSQGTVAARKGCKENDEAGAVVHARDNFPRRWWTWVCSKVVADGYH